MSVQERELLAGAIDYAGLFPPAGLDMETAVANYRRYRAGEDGWALGRFVCPVGRLTEFAVARGHGGGVWPIAAVCTGEPHEEASAIARFNQDYFGRSRVEAVEAKTPDGAAVRVRAAASQGLQVFCELEPAAPEFRTTADAVHTAGARAKLRTGGVVAAAIPSPDAVATFLVTCRSLGLAFKATAGLHHASRGRYPLTYAADAPEAIMHGFVNLALASTALAAGGSPAEAIGMLEAASPAPEHWTGEQIAAGRRFFLGFGSCSFEEPLAWAHRQRSPVQS